MRNPLVRRATGSLGVNIVSRVISIVFGIVLARAMGAAGYGIYAYAFALLEVLKLPTTLGLPVMVTRLVAAYQTHGEWSLLRGLLLRANQAVLVMSAVIILVAIVASHYLSSVDSEMRATFWISLMLLPLLGVAALRAATLRGLHYTVLAQLPELIIQPVVALVIIGGFWQLSDQIISPKFAMSAQVVAATTAFALGTMWLIRRMPEETRNVGSAYQSTEWARSAVPFLISGGLFLVNGQTGVIILGWSMPPDDVAVYRVAMIGATLISFGLTAANATLAPIFTRLHTENNLISLQRLVTISARAVTAFSIPVAVVFILFGKQLLGFVFGEEFQAGATALAILAVGQLVNATVGSVGLILEMTGNVRDNARGAAFSAIVNVALNVILVPIWGVNGAAIATAVSLILWNFFLSYFVQRRLGIYSTAFGKMNFLKRKH